MPTWSELFDKAKAALYVAAMVGLLAVLAMPVAGWRWERALSVFAAAAAPVLAVVLRRELSGYGAGIPTLDDAIPGGTPLPSGSDSSEGPM